MIVTAKWLQIGLQQKKVNKTILPFHVRVRVSWGQVENFKCVDYFQIEYYEQSDPEGTAKLTGKINRHRKSHDIDIKPCRDYLFKV